MGKHLVSWVGQADLNAAAGKDSPGLGPLAEALTVRTYDAATVLCNYPEEKFAFYLDWLGRRTGAVVDPRQIDLPTPMDFRAIYQQVSGVLTELGDVERVYHLSPGTPAMTATWILLAKTTYPAELIRSSLEEGVVDADVPFDIAAELLPR